MSEVKVNKISPRSGTTVTLGDSGDTFTIPSGATINNQGTATNFGATGSASWTTTVKTSGFTAVAGEGYFVDTTSGAISVNLPAGTPGAVVAFKDYAGTFSASNKVTLVQNGSDKIGGSTVNAILDTEGIAVTLVFVDSTEGWLVTDSGLQSEAPTASFISATGGTVATCGNFKVHQFTGPGNFCVSAVGNACGSNAVEYMVVAGGGGGGAGRAGGGGGGGFRTCTAKPVSVQNYPVTIGAGGAGGADSVQPGCGENGTSGSPTTALGITSTGGGAGGGGDSSTASAGGSGGGGGGAAYPKAGGAGNTPPVSPPQGNAGGTSTGTGPGGPLCAAASGGGGGGAVGTDALGPGSSSVAGPGGAGGDVTPIFGASPKPFYAPTNGVYAGGGGGGASAGPSYGNPGSRTVGAGGPGGGGAGGLGNNAPAASAGTTNTGGGGGGGGHYGGGAPSPGFQGKAGGAGGSGVVLIRYKFQ